MNRNGQAYSDASYTATTFVMVNDIEILAYTLGASATVLSKFFVSRVAAFSSETTSNQASMPSISFSEWSPQRVTRWRLRNLPSHPYRATEDEESKPPSLDGRGSQERRREKENANESVITAADDTPTPSMSTHEHRPR